MRVGFMLQGPVLEGAGVRLERDSAMYSIIAAEWPERRARLEARLSRT